MYGNLQLQRTTAEVRSRLVEMGDEDRRGKKYTTQECRLTTKKFFQQRTNSSRRSLPAIPQQSTIESITEWWTAHILKPQNRGRSSLTLSVRVPVCTSLSVDAVIQSMFLSVVYELIKGECQTTVLKSITSELEFQW